MIQILLDVVLCAVFIFIGSAGGIMAKNAGFYIPFLMVFIVVFFLVYYGAHVLFSMMISNQTRKLMEKYTADGDLGAYLNGHEKLVKIVRTKTLKFVLYNNMAYGYTKNKDFTTAAKFLEDIDPKYYSKNLMLKLLYYYNLASCYFHIFEPEKAVEILNNIPENNRTIFKNHKYETYRRLWLFDEINRKVAENKLDEAKALCDEFMEKYGNDNENAVEFIKENILKLFE